MLHGLCGIIGVLVAATSIIHIIIITIILENGVAIHSSLRTGLLLRRRLLVCLRMCACSSSTIRIMTAL